MDRAVAAPRRLVSLRRELASPIVRAPWTRRFEERSKAWNATGSHEPVNRRSLCRPVLSARGGSSASTKPSQPLPRYRYLRLSASLISLDPHLLASYAGNRKALFSGTGLFRCTRCPLFETSDPRDLPSAARTLADGTLFQLGLTEQGKGRLRIASCQP